MYKTLSKTITLIEEKADQYYWHCKFCGGDFGKLEMWENHSPEKECEADRHWFYYTCKKCGQEWSLKTLVNDTHAGFFTRRKTFMEELMEV